MFPVLTATTKKVNPAIEFGGWEERGENRARPSDERVPQSQYVHRMKEKYSDTFRDCKRRDGTSLSSMQELE